MKLNPGYRTSGEDDNFFYFVTRILPTTSTVKRGVHLMSDMYTVLDEAFALVMLYNEYDRWKEQLEIEQNPSLEFAHKEKKKKRFCDPKSGRSEGWTNEGRKLLNSVCRDLEELRAKEETGKDVEIAIRNRIEKRKGSEGNNVLFGEEDLTMEDKDDLEDIDEYVQGGILEMLQASRNEIDSSEKGFI